MDGVLVDFQSGIDALGEGLKEVYNERWDEITQTMSDEMGAPLDWSSSAQTSSGADHIDDFIYRFKKFNLIY